jgi:hypothetical protein
MSSSKHVLKDSSSSSDSSSDPDLSRIPAERYRLASYSTAVRYANKKKSAATPAPKRAKRGHPKNESKNEENGPAQVDHNEETPEKDDEDDKTLEEERRPLFESKKKHKDGSLQYLRPLCPTQELVKLKKINSNLEHGWKAGLTVAVDANNKPTIWGAIRHSLTWSIDEGDIQNYKEQIESAFDSWELACDVQFSFVRRNGFIHVRWATEEEEHEGEGVIAAAFFPGDAERHIKLYQLFRSQFNSVSVLRHEIGHSLGFRHEHIWFPNNPTGEDTEGAKLVTAKDKNSIMNYNKIWNDTSAHKQTELSKLDKVGCRLMYGVPRGEANLLM